MADPTIPNLACPIFLPSAVKALDTPKPAVGGGAGAGVGGGSGGGGSGNVGNCNCGIWTKAGQCLDYHGYQVMRRPGERPNSDPEVYTVPAGHIWRLWSYSWDYITNALVSPVVAYVLVYDDDGDIMQWVGKHPIPHDCGGPISFVSGSDGSEPLGRFITESLGPEVYLQGGWSISGNLAGNLADVYLDDPRMVVEEWEIIGCGPAATAQPGVSTQYGGPIFQMTPIGNIAGGFGPKP